MPAQGHAIPSALTLLVLLSGCTAPVPAGDVSQPTNFATASEVEILDRYLAQFDLPASTGEHCRRHGGSDLIAVAGVPDLPPMTPPPTAPVAPTNALAAHHLAWHKRYADLVSVVTPGNPDPASDYGQQFVTMHRHMLHEYDAWRASEGYPPIPTWDAMSAVPESWRLPPTPDVPPFDVNPGRLDACYAHTTEDPQAERPTWTMVPGGNAPSPFWSHQRLCDFGSLNDLAKAVDYDTFNVYSQQDVLTQRYPRYHANVHDTMRGDMGLSTAVRDPVFWAWHNFLDKDVFGLWESECM